ncbi:Cd(II)/Pb(II)-responsive transcriptional regulator [Pseudothauera nasutitermitis]|uniref:Cd(II)/Pb(II)-responsive transcriptional regulator n=1 Tax=Pseudothauera nasutitermitis TaxID=2565930 RepID=A0A4V3WC69_9RHOO|nr:Cd(II)/Pb(II)-responsive transcriptional regulator [Pseudothauera nasutitermitis]THF66098.1 Cd(II)/Pb(II)-responsive transcriptional regulator [Pseudothauera nasutitermitis]
MKIGDLARTAQCTVETVRYYEREGLLPPPARTAGNFRDYGHEHADRLRFIRNCRALDMSHGEIRSVLALADQPAAGCGAVNEVFDQHIAHVDERIRELEQLRGALLALRERCRHEQAVEACGILQGLAEMESEPRHERHTHLG